MLTLIDLMEIYRIKSHKTENLDYLYDIINGGEVNSLIDRQQLALEILKECGSRAPRYNTTDTFKTFGVNFFKLQKDFIDRTLTLIAYDYNALETFKTERTEEIERKHNEKRENTRTDNLSELRTDNLNELRTDNLNELRTDNLSELRTDNLQERTSESYTDEHFVSAENESGVMLRTRDTHSENDTVNDGKFNTGTQTTANTGTQTTANTGTQSKANTGTQSKANTGTQKSEESSEITHDDTVTIGEHGYKISPNIEFFNALKRNEYNIYSELAIKFSDTMCLCVF